MKYKILTVLFVFLLLIGCKVELPEQAAGGASAVSATSSAQSSSQETSSAEGASSVQRDTVSQAESSQAVSKDTSPASNTAVAQSASPVSSAKTAPRPVAPTSSKAPEAKELTCSLSVSCGDILAHKDKFTQEQLEAVPANGTILQEDGVSFQAGETVFQVLLRETKRLKIPMDHINSPAFQTEYVKAIGSVYEKDYGASSGWLFAVNGKQPAVGCSAYKLKDGDKIQWIFNCGQ